MKEGETVLWRNLRAVNSRIQFMTDRLYYCVSQGLTELLEGDTRVQRAGDRQKQTVAAHPACVTVQDELFIRQITVPLFRQKGEHIFIL